jgi:large subunit ribosomal protein L15
MPLQRRLPKRGFNNTFKKEFALVSLSQLDGLTGEETISVDVLVSAGIVKKGMLVKVLANGEVTKPLKVQVDKISKAAQSKIEAAGGTVIS